MAGDHAVTRRRAVRGLILPGVLLAVALAVLVTLGNWQMDRLAWKLDLIETVDARIDAPAVAPPGPQAWEGLDPDAVAYRHVRLSGRFLPGEVHVFTSLADPKGRYGGPGYWVMSPFETEDGWRVFVNRGFVPDDLKEPASRSGSAAPRGRVEIDGTLRPGEEETWLTPDPEPGKNIWFVRNPRQLAQATGQAGAPIAPYTIDLRASMIPEGGLPQPGETMVRFENPHLGYAVTWYGLALAALGVFIFFAAAQLRRPPARPDAG